MYEEIYSKIVVSSAYSWDGETPDRIILTEEANGYALWKEGETLFHGTELVEYLRYCDKNYAIEQAVLYATEFLKNRPSNEEIKEILTQRSAGEPEII